MGGNIELSARNLEVINGARLSSSNFGTGNAGNIDLEARRLLIQNGAQIASASLGRGNAGDLTIYASEMIEIDGGSATDTGLFTQVGARVGGPGEGTVGNELNA